MIITTSRGTSAILWDSEGKIAHILRGHDDAMNGAAFSPDGVLAATVSDDGTLRVWDIAAGTALTLLGGLGGVIEAVFSPDGHALLTVSSDAVVRIYPLPVYGSITETEMASRHLNLVAR